MGLKVMPSFQYHTQNLTHHVLFFAQPNARHDPLHGLLLQLAELQNGYKAHKPSQHYVLLLPLPP